jgi:hypothetical protein
MDEEDLAEIAENRKLVDTTQELDLGGAPAVDPENECDACGIVVILR